MELLFTFGLGADLAAEPDPIPPPPPPLQQSLEDEHPDGLLLLLLLLLLFSSSRLVPFPSERLTLPFPHLLVPPSSLTGKIGGKPWSFFSLLG